MINKLICFLLLAQIMFVGVGQGVELNGKMKALSAQPETIWEGDVFEAKLMIWPFAVQYETFKEDLKSISLEESIKLLKINRQGYSLNNNELYEIEGVFVLLKKPDASGLKIKIRELEIDVAFENLIFESTRERLLEPYIAKQVYENFTSRYFYIITLTSGIIFIFIFYLLRSKRRFSKGPIREYSKVEEYKQIIAMAQTRADFEKIYQLKNKWKDLVNDREIMNQFIEYMNKVQYRQNWSAHDYEVVQLRTKNLENCFKESNHDV